MNLQKSIANLSIRPHRLKAWHETPCSLRRSALRFLFTQPVPEAPILQNLIHFFSFPFFQLILPNQCQKHNFCRIWWTSFLVSFFTPSEPSWIVFARIYHESFWYFFSPNCWCQKKKTLLQFSSSFSFFLIRLVPKDPFLELNGLSSLQYHHHLTQPVTKEPLLWDFTCNCDLVPLSSRWCHKHQFCYILLFKSWITSSKKSHLRSCVTDYW